MKELPKQRDLAITTLGPCRIRSPVKRERFVDEAGGVLLCRTLDQLKSLEALGESPPAFEAAGPRSKIFFDPRELTCGIVTCGGLCPGLNDVIRSIVLTLHYAYGARRVLGFRYGYAGLSSMCHYEPLELTPEDVDEIHGQGGTILGSSRGPQDVEDMVDVLQERGVGILFAVGGDGTLRGASTIAREILRRKLLISVIGIPKTIDNDLEWLIMSFGFTTAVEEARKSITAAHNEARGALDGIGLVKLMGRHSGFIAANATLSCSDVNFCLVPEVPFLLDGEGGLLCALERRLDDRHHAVIVVAEGAAQDILQGPVHQERDASGNLRLKDVGVFLRDQMSQYLTGRKRPCTIKYIDPSYTIRSLPANAMDSEYCLMLGQHAVHAGMAGRTDMLVGYWNNNFTHVPISLSAGKRKKIDPQGALWQSVLATTGQGDLGARE
jgi:6-phosphofructokinase 1